MRDVKCLGAFLVLLALAVGARSQEPGKPAAGPRPLPEMTAEDRYKGEDGGLYGGGRNEPPAAHQDLAGKELGRVVPRDREGNPAGEGKVVFISIGMSNLTQEFAVFKTMADEDPLKSRKLVIVDCAQGGQTMKWWADSQAQPWTVAERRLQAAGVSPKQVQMAVVKVVNGLPSGDFRTHGKKLEQDTIAVLHNAKERFPNLRIVYLVSRIYGGYSTANLSPEPYAYESAFVVRWLIQGQMQGNAELNCDPARGAVKAPLLLWGPYLWANGMTPRQTDGLVWERTDLSEADGTHPTENGRKKVAEMLLKFSKTDRTARACFSGEGAAAAVPAPAVPAAKNAPQPEFLLPENVVLEADIEYGRAGERSLKLDLLRPRNQGETKLPVLVHIHGGGWRQGSKEGGRRTLSSFVNSGNYVGVTVGYRLTGEAIWPAQIHDCKAAIRWIRANAEKYHLDPERIGAMGHSAGGHLVALLGTSGDVEELEGNNGNPGHSSRVRCVADAAGPSDFPHFLEQPGAGGRGAVIALLGGTPAEQPDTARAASPVTWVSPDDPPFLIVHGTEDHTVPFAQAEALAAALKKAGVPTTFLRLEGGGHVTSHPEIGLRHRAFLEHHLRGGPGEISEAPIAVSAQTGRIPAGFSPILNGKDLAGWHVSKEYRQGDSQGWTVQEGALLATQDRPGNGGLLLTDKKYSAFEIYLEVKLDFGCDGGLFLRSNEKGQAYQVMLDYLPSRPLGRPMPRGMIGGVYGEDLQGVTPELPEGWVQVWRADDWNALRARMEGTIPHITVWLNDTKITDWTDTANHSADGAEDGMIGLQVHGGQRWAAGKSFRFRNLAVKELKNLE